MSTELIENSRTEAPPMKTVFTNAVLGQPYSSETFIKYHLAISSNEYIQNLHNELYKYNSDGMSVFQAMNPKADDFLYYLQRVGSNYGWDKREKYQEDNKADLEQIFQDSQTRLYIFKAMGQEIGFCLVTGIDMNEANREQKDYEQGIDKAKAIHKFRRQQKLRDDDSIESIEINKFGLYDEHTGKGYGNYFLSEMLHILINKYRYDEVYLDTRSTNHKGVIKFYEKNGFHTFFEEELKSDLVAQEAPLRSQPNIENTPTP